MKIKTDGIIFDVDGTLWDSTFVIANAWNQILSSEGLTLRLTAEQLKNEFGKPLSVIGENLMPDIDSSLRTRILEQFIEAEATVIQTDTPPLYPGLLPVLETLSSHLPLYIVSNAEKGYIEGIYAATGIGRYFQDHLCFGDTNRPKGENIRLMAERHHLKHPVYVGDTFGDYEAARMAGVTFIHAAYGFGRVPESDGVLQNISELPEFFPAP